LVALAAVTAVERIRERLPTLGEPEVLFELLNALATRPDWHGLYCYLSCLAATRGPMAEDCVASLCAPVSGFQRSLLLNCLSVTHRGILDLHPMVRRDLRMRWMVRADERVPAQPGEEWNLDWERVHAQFASYYSGLPGGASRQLRNEMEAFYHGTLTG